MLSLSWHLGSFFAAHSFLSVVALGLSMWFEGLVAPQHVES